jgi:cellulose synthase/poly-beta-1,6-N-acetylglucosamine synthase-like glycosyltransferase
MAVILEMPALVLPKAPDDSDKLMYIRSGRWLVTSIGMLSFVSLSAGMVLFIKASVAFYWFGAFFVFFAAYMTMSYVAVGLRGKDFDYVKHQATVAEGADFRPDVDIYLPICGEDLILIGNTWTHVADLDWPRERVHVYVLDDADNPDARAMARTFGFHYIVRDDRPHLKKAGNLRYAFARTTSPFITILDADFCPRPDFLREVIPYFKDGKLAILQTPQFFKVRPEQKWVERGAGIVQELFYRAVQVNRDRFGAAICVGTCGTYRRTALEPFGGTAAIDYSEDVHTGFHVLDAGWHVKYIPVCLASGVCPDNLPAFFIQQYRWAMGSTTLFLNPEFWKSTLTVMQKVAYLSGMMYYWATALGIFMNPVPSALLVWVKPSAVLWYNIAFAVPSILMSHVVMRVWCKQPYGWSALSVKAVQNYAHLYAIRDKLMGSMVPWVPTGGASSKKCARFDSARRLCWVWSVLSTGAVVTGCGLRIWQEYLPWYAVAPTIAATLLNFATHLGMMLAPSVPKKALESDLQAPLPVE